MNDASTNDTETTEPEEHRRAATAAPEPDLNSQTKPDPQPAEAAAATTSPGNATAAPTESAPLNRRRFLSGLLGGAATLVAAACGRDRATPTPTLRASATPGRASLLPSPTPTGSERLYLPSVYNNPDLAVAAAQTSPLEPTATPTPAAPTATQPPPPTPTPIATDFPAGPPSKLGIVVMRNLPGIFDLLATQSIPVVCTLELDPNFLAQIKQTAPRTQIVARLPDNIDQIELGTLDPLNAARAYVEQRLLPYATDPQRQPYIDAWQGYNEPVAGNAEEMKRLAEFEAERVRLLAERGIRSVIGNFGAGQPTGDP
ncbi:MAG: hypothetical protein KDE47_23960, partial [Caldilineaceae bacterium]|nr:hypothetical protein [Caldilineaceae bacterium]